MKLASSLLCAALALPYAAAIESQHSDGTKDKEETLIEAGWCEKCEGNWDADDCKNIKEETKDGCSRATLNSDETTTTTTNGNSGGDTAGVREVETASTKMATLDLSKIKKFANRNRDALFSYIEQSQAAASDDNTAHFGRFLDAGTGSHSMHWIASIIHRDNLLHSTNHGEQSAPRASLTSYTAVTATDTMRRKVLAEARELGVVDAGEVIAGNWQSGLAPDGRGGVTLADSDADGANGALLKGQTFDTILVDYLVGAIDGFAPYFQDQVFHRLASHLAPGGRVYVVGLQPIPDKADGDADVLCRIVKARDASILMAGRRPYREYPREWIERHVVRAGMTVVESREYPTRYSKYTLTRQINEGRSKLKLFKSKGMAREMSKVLDSLEEESAKVIERQPDGRITLGFDYVVVAERPR